ncbi:MAG: hypothetical protein LBG65_02520 [Puniceicoccales bacterium]|jgi:hypothetical protein|nr:hypothetical protein [Puniceicoccales bacterium]
MQSVPCRMQEIPRRSFSFFRDKAADVAGMAGNAISGCSQDFACQVDRADAWRRAGQPQARGRIAVLWMACQSWLALCKASGGAGGMGEVLRCGAIALGSASSELLSFLLFFILPWKMN